MTATELFSSSAHSSQESGCGAQSNSTQVGFHGFTLLQHLRSMWVCGAKSVLVGLFVSTPDIYQANRKCQWMPDVSSGYDAALEKPELLIHSLPPSPNSCLLSPCPFTCLFSLSSSRSLLLPCAEQPTPVKDQKSKVWIMDPMHILAETVNIYFYSWVLLVLL